jgi:hypothetical protein
MPSDYYVYLLVEERSGGEEIFYVGKGRGARGGAHLLDYVRSVAAGAEVAESLRLAEAQPLAGDSVVVAPSEALRLADIAQQEEHAKVQRIRRVHLNGDSVRVDLLRTDLAESEAFAIESAVIDAIGLDHLTNLVHGHGHGRVPALAAMRVLDAESVTIEEAGFQVVVSGVWGGGNSLSGLLAAGPEAVWENARQSWAISASRRHNIDAAGVTTSPYILIAVAKGPTATYGGIILGVWEIVRVERASDRIDEMGRAIEGWAYVAAPDSPRVAALRQRYVYRRSTHRRQVGPTSLR